MQHPQNIRPASLFYEGEHWVPKAWADGLLDALREKQRTQQAHNHQFATIQDCFDSLPATHASAPYAASVDAFRKHGLIATGHCDVQTVDAGTHEAACTVAPLVSALAKKAHGYALTVVRGPLVICSTPHSQSFKAMGKDVFQKSKADVLNWAETMLGVR